MGKCYGQGSNSNLAVLFFYILAPVGKKGIW